MAQRDGDELERQRQQADGRYNEALTAVDRAVARTPQFPAPPDASDSTPSDLAALAQATAPLPAKVPWWPGGRWLRTAWQRLSLILGRQQTFNEHVARALTQASAKERASRRALVDTLDAVRGGFATLQEFQTALVVFLQQITPFVETKDRLLTAAVERRLEEHQRALAGLQALEDQIGLLQRASQMMQRQLRSPRAAREDAVGDSASGTSADAPGGPRASASSPPEAIDACKYVGFEDRFRGSDEQVSAKLGLYLPVFTGRSRVLDLGCGRGEFVALLTAQGVTASGVDANPEMVALARERGLDVAQADALEYLASLPDEALGGLMASQVVEHLEPGYLVRLLETAYDKLQPGSPIVVETINPACWLAFFSSYLRDPTHVRAVHPETLQYLLQASGFTRVTLQYSAPVPDEVKMKLIELPAEVLTSDAPAARALTGAARIVNGNAAILNNLLFTYLDYAAIGQRP